MDPAIPIALQLYSLRGECADRGLAPVMADVAQMGYDGVEFAGFHGLNAPEVRTLLEDNGLQVAGTHTPLNDLLGDKLAATIDYNLTIGNKFVIIPALPEERRSSLDAWRESAALINDLSSTLAEHGLLIGYHTHSVEFMPIDGVVPWDVFCRSTRPEVVLQLDTANALAGGADVVPFLRKYPNRSLTFHLKEHSPDPEKMPLIGEGDVNWSEVFALCPTIGATQWYIIEQERYAQPPLECVQQCLTRVRRMLAAG
jgi:sugar phosphate isomerase/epimerase